MDTATQLLYRQPSLPIFQNRMYNSRDEALECRTGDMCLVQNLRTGLISNQAFRPDLLIYDSAYQNEQGVSELFKAHMRGVMDIVDRSIGRRNLVEVGCGKGTFLEMLQESGFEVAGFDPTYEGTNPSVEKHLFSKGIGIKAEGLILRHVLEHIPEPVAFLQNLSEANQGAGRIYIEVPCLDWICERRTWFDIFYEHVNYFRLSDFHRIFGRVVEIGRVFGGQYLYVVAELDSVRQPEMHDSTEHFHFPSEFTAGICAAKYTTDRPAIVWGGASKGVIFSLLRSRAGFPVQAVVDINPAKQGKFLAGTGLKVEPPEEVVPRLKRGDPIFVMNSNYLKEIKTMTNNEFTYIQTDNE
ncbi:MAG: class I SAM-dependent methyltransferase [Chthoniobacterales bacterium]